MQSFSKDLVEQGHRKLYSVTLELNKIIFFTDYIPNFSKIKKKLMLQNCNIDGAVYIKSLLLFYQRGLSANNIKVT